MTYCREGLGISVPYASGITGPVNPYYAGGTVTWGGVQVPKSVPWTPPPSPPRVAVKPVTTIPPVLRAPVTTKLPTLTTVPKPSISLAPIQAGGGGGIVVPSGSYATSGSGGVASESSDMSSGFMSAFTGSPILLIVLGLGALVLMDKKGRR